MKTTTLIEAGIEIQTGMARIESTNRRLVARLLLNRHEVILTRLPSPRPSPEGEGEKCGSMSKDIIVRINSISSPIFLPIATFILLAPQPRDFLKGGLNSFKWIKPLDH